MDRRQEDAVAVSVKRSQTANQRKRFSFLRDIRLNLASVPLTESIPGDSGRVPGCPDPPSSPIYTAVPPSPAKTTSTMYELERDESRRSPSPQSSTIGSILLPLIGPRPTPLPPTSNNLDAKAKKKLLVSARKVSKVLGEVPILSDEESSGDEPPLSRTKSRSTVVSELPRANIPRDCDKPKKKSLSRAARLSLQKSLVLPLIGRRPSLPFALSPTSPTSPSFGVSATPRLPPVLKIDTRLTVTESMKLSPDSSDISSLSNFTFGTAQEIPVTVYEAPVPDSNPTEARRTKLAKLNRHLGETVPLELVFQTDPIFQQAFPSSEPTGQVKRKASSQTINVLPRRRTRSQPSSPHPANFGHSPSKPRINRSHSLRHACKGPADAGQENQLSDRQKAVHVKRAKKMTKLFGDLPPDVLAQITNVKSKDDSKVADMPVSPVSITMESPNYLTADTSPFSTLSRRMSDSSMIPLRPPSASSRQESFESARDSMSNQSLSSEEKSRRRASICTTPSTPPPFSSYPAVPPSAQQRPSLPSLSSPSLFMFSDEAPRRSCAEVQRQITFDSTLQEVQDPGASQAQVVSSNVLALPPNPDFRARRLRAAKLTRFFGVDYNDLSCSMNSDRPRSSSGSALDGAPLARVESYGRPSKSTRKNQPLTVTVQTRTDVRIDRNQRVWALGSHAEDPGNVMEVMARLRELK